MYFRTSFLTFTVFSSVVTHLHLPHLCKLLQLLRQRVKRWGTRGVKRLQAPSAAVSVQPTAGRAGHTGSVSPPAGMSSVGLPAWLDSVQRIMLLHSYMAALVIWQQACLCLLRAGDSICACGIQVWLHISVMQKGWHMPYTKINKPSHLPARLLAVLQVLALACNAAAVV